MTAAKKPRGIPMNAIESLPSYQFMVAMKRTAIPSLDQEDVFAFSRGMHHVVSGAAVRIEGNSLVALSDLKLSSEAAAEDFTLGFLNVLADIFEVTIVADPSGFDPRARDVLRKHGYMPDRDTRLFVRLPRSFQRQAA